MRGTGPEREIERRLKNSPASDVVVASKKAADAIN